MKKRVISLLLSAILVAAVTAPGALAECEANVSFPDTISVSDPVSAAIDRDGNLWMWG